MFRKNALLGILVFLSFFFCGCEKKENVVEFKPQEEILPSEEIGELYERELVDAWLKENHNFLNIAFTNCSKPDWKDEVSYDSLASKMKVLRGYLLTFGEEVTILEDYPMYKVRVSDLNSFSQKLFHEEMDVLELQSSYSIQDGWVSLPLGTGLGVSIPVFWKFEKKEEDVYTMYVLDYACSIEQYETILDEYQPGTALKEEDIQKYHPGLIQITFQHKDGQNYLLSSQFSEHYFG